MLAVLKFAVLQFAGNGLVAMGGATFGAIAAAPVAAAAAVGAGLFLFLFTVLAGFLFEERLPISDGDLIIIRMDFREGEESMAVAAIFDKGRLKGRFDPCHLGEIDIASERFLIGCLEIEILNAVTAQHHNPGLLRVRCIYKHLVGHRGLL